VPLLAQPGDERPGGDMTIPMPVFTELHEAIQALRPGVTACVAAHPARFTNGKLDRALRSVYSQTRQPDAILVVNDRDRRGAGWTRQQILRQVQTEWMAWCDSDDEWLPQHLQRCLDTAEATDAMFVYPWMTEDNDPLGHFGIPFNPATPHHTTITFLVRTEIAQRVGFVNDPFQGDSQRYGNEDWHHIVGLSRHAVANDLPMVHLAERTWRYHADGGNTSGVPGQGDAL
jgi:glycosyltransferase involved in cell wall biosynthesis